MTSSTSDLKMKCHLRFHLPSKDFYTADTAWCVQEIFLLGEEVFLLNQNLACSAYTLEEEGTKSKTPRKGVSVCSREDWIWGGTALKP